MREVSLQNLYKNRQVQGGMRPTTKKPRQNKNKRPHAGKTWGCGDISNECTLAVDGVRRLMGAKGSQPYGSTDRGDELRRYMLII